MNEGIGSELVVAGIIWCVMESTIITTIDCSDVGYCLFRDPLVMHIPYHVPFLLL